MTGFATIDSAVEAVKLGAIDYLTKPFDLQRLRQLLRDVRDEADAAARGADARRRRSRSVSSSAG